DTRRAAMQLDLAFLDPPNPTRHQSTSPWDEIDPGARAAAIEILSRLIARMLAARPAKDATDE
ncbi:MAG TPA: hypothetical protein VGL34_17650, partial [Steroidobacteraceae bacterium]